MVGGERLDAIQEAIESQRPPNGDRLGMPEILFGDSALELQHDGSGTTLRVSLSYW